MKWKVGDEFILKVDTEHGVLEKGSMGNIKGIKGERVSCSIKNINYPLSFNWTVGIYEIRPLTKLEKALK